MAVTDLAAPEAAGYGCKARLRELEQAILDYVLKSHQAPAQMTEVAPTA